MITTLSLNVVSNYSLTFIQLLSTLDAWVGSNTPMALFILTQHPGERLAFLDETIPFLQCHWNPLVIQCAGRGGGRRFIRVPREPFLKPVGIKYFLYVSIKTH